MKVHNLKTWPEYFDAVAEGRKTFELRLNDRDFKIGDRLDLFKFDPDTNDFNGERTSVYVTYVLHGGKFGLEEGYCIMGFLDEPHEWMR